MRLRSCYMAFALLAFGAGLLSGKALIYEPFVDSDSSLDGNAVGTGLTGTWYGSGSVQAGSLTNAALVESLGNKATFSNTYGGADTGSTLTDAGLLADGSNLWFSVLIRTGSDIAINGDLGFALGTDRLGSGNGFSVINGGIGLGLSFDRNLLRVSYWNAGSEIQSTVNSNNSASPNTQYLVVGKYTWGASSDSLELYRPDEELDLGSPISTYTTPTNIVQSTLDTVTIGSKSASPPHMFDEIRFGATVEDVLPVPPPAGLVLIIQ